PLHRQGARRPPGRLAGPGMERGWTRQPVHSQAACSAAVLTAPLIDVLPDAVVAVDSGGQIAGAWGGAAPLPDTARLAGRSFVSLFSAPRAARELLAAGIGGRAAAELKLRDGVRVHATAAP